MRTLFHFTFPISNKEELKSKKRGYISHIHNARRTPLAIDTTRPETKKGRAKGSLEKHNKEEEERNRQKTWKR